MGYQGLTEAFNFAGFKAHLCLFSEAFKGFFILIEGGPSSKGALSTLFSLSGDLEISISFNHSKGV